MSLGAAVSADKWAFATPNGAYSPIKDDLASTYSWLDTDSVCVCVPYSQLQGGGGVVHYIR